MITVLSVTIRVCDHPFKTEEKIVGVFDEIGDVEGAKKAAREKYGDEPLTLRRFQLNTY
jgi:hypothetical protein